MLRTSRESKAAPKIWLASCSVYHRGSSRCGVKLPTEIDDCTLFGRCTNTSVRPFSAGSGAVLTSGSARRSQPPNAFSAAANTASGATSPTTIRKALFGR